MGTPVFAAQVLRDLAPYEHIVGVFTQPDSIAKRGRKKIPSPVRTTAEELEIDVFYPEDVCKPSSIGILESLAPDAIIVVAYGQILSPRILEMPRLGCLNIHASLLPRWRGAAPIERAILAGDGQIGLCFMQMEEGLDTGPYCYSKAFPAAGKNYEEIAHEMLDGIGMQLHMVLDDIDYTPERVVWKEQDEAQTIYAEKIGKRELYISPDDDATTIERKVLASSHSRSAKAVICEKPVSLISVRKQDAKGISGNAGDVVFQGKRLYIIASDSHAVEVLALRPDGKNDMSAKSFCAGIPSLRETGKGKWESPR